MENKYWVSSWFVSNFYFFQIPLHGLYQIYYCTVNLTQLVSYISDQTISSSNFNVFLLLNYLIFFKNQ